LHQRPSTRRPANIMRNSDSLSINMDLSKERGSGISQDFNKERVSGISQDSNKERISGLSLDFSKERLSGGKKIGHSVQESMDSTLRGFASSLSSRNEPQVRRSRSRGSWQSRDGSNSWPVGSLMLGSEFDTNVVDPTIVDEKADGTTIMLESGKDFSSLLDITQPSPNTLLEPTWGSKSPGPELKEFSFIPPAPAAVAASTAAAATTTTATAAVLATEDPPPNPTIDGNLPSSSGPTSAQDGEHKRRKSSLIREQLREAFVRQTFASPKEEQPTDHRRVEEEKFRKTNYTNLHQRMPPNLHPPGTASRDLPFNQRVAGGGGSMNPISSFQGGTSPRHRRLGARSIQPMEGVVHQLQGNQLSNNNTLLGGLGGGGAQTAASSSSSPNMAAAAAAAAAASGVTITDQRLQQEHLRLLEAQAKLQQQQQFLAQQQQLLHQQAVLRAAQGRTAAVSAAAAAAAQAVAHQRRQQAAAAAASGLVPGIGGGGQRPIVQGGGRGQLQNNNNNRNNLAASQSSSSLSPTHNYIRSSRSSSFPSAAARGSATAASSAAAPSLSSLGGPGGGENPLISPGSCM